MLVVKLYTVRENLRAGKKEYGKTEDDLKSLQSIGQIIGEVLRPLDNKRGNTFFSRISVVCRHFFLRSMDFKE